MVATDSIKLDIPRSVVAEIIMERLNSLGVPAPIARPSALPAIGATWNGGLYAGLTIHDNAPCALVLLPGVFKGDWKAALAWAAVEMGGALPSRFDALTLFKNLKDELEPEYYWTSEPNASNESYAWLQNFNYGLQGYDLKDDVYRARAVRRITI